MALHNAITHSTVENWSLLKLKCVSWHGMDILFSLLIYILINNAKSLYTWVVAIFLLQTIVKYCTYVYFIVFTQTQPTQPKPSKGHLISYLIKQATSWFSKVGNQTRLVKAEARSLKLFPRRNLYGSKIASLKWPNVYRWGRVSNKI